MQSFYLYDRPFFILPYLITIPLLGSAPQTWQLFALLLQFCVALTVWLLLRQVWPHRKLLAEQAALLFLVYPTFTQQSLSVTYVPHFLAYIMLFLSLWFTAKALRDPKNYLLFTTLALATGILNIFTLEYFTGLELIRFFIIFYILRRQALPLASSWQKAFKHWLPYLLVFILFVVWRVFIAHIPEDPNQLSLLSSFLASPVSTSVTFVQDVVRTFIHILVSTWQTTFNPELVIFTDLSLLFSWGVAILAGISAAAYLLFADGANQKHGDDKKEDWGPQAVGFGALAVFLSMLPVHLIQKDLFSGLFSDRLTLPAMFGAAIFWVGIGKLALKSGAHRAILISILVGLAVGTQLRISHAYTLDWQKQLRAYWQLYWRSGSIESNTPIVFSGALSGYVSEYSASAAINTLYNSPIDAGRVNYWVFDFFDDFDGTQDFASLTPASARLRNLFFQGPLNTAVFVHHSQSQCLWVLNTDHLYNPDVPSSFREIGSSGDLSALASPDEQGILPDRRVFGDEPLHDWCYFYQKMDQAKQGSDWARILALWAEATQQGFTPNNQFELVPVLAALQNTSRWSEALDLSRAMLSRQLNIRSVLCSYWVGRQAELFPNTLQPEIAAFMQDLDCETR